MKRIQMMTLFFEKPFKISALESLTLFVAGKPINCSGGKLFGEGRYSQAIQLSLNLDIPVWEHEPISVALQDS